MQRHSAVHNVTQAMRVLKSLSIQSEAFVSVRDLSQKAVRVTLEAFMDQRIERYLGNVRAEPGPSLDRRNGHYRRWLMTAVGELELQVPRTRTRSAIEVVEAYARRERSVDRLILAAFVLGLSTRKVGETLQALLGQRVSASTVSRVARQLDVLVEAFHRRSLANRYRVLVLDGVVLSHRTGRDAVRRPVLVALGITNDGRREILDFRVARGESQAAWESFLQDLERRGLTGEGLALIATDGGCGLLAALPLIYPRVRVQRCWAHKTRNLLDKVRLADREAVKRHLHRISHAPDRTHARAQARAFVDRWSPRYPAAVRCLWGDIDELLTFFVFPDDEWRKAARTTNAIERRFREVRRRTRPMGVMANKESLERILFAVFTHENQKQGVVAKDLFTTETPRVESQPESCSSILGHP